MPLKKLINALNILPALCLIFLLASCGTINKHNQQIAKLHPVEDLQEDIDAFYKQLQLNHPRLFQFSSKETMDFKFDSLKKAITAPMDSRTFYKELAAVTTHIGQGHLGLSPPSARLTKKERKARIKTKFDVDNLDFEYLDDKLFIVDAREKDTVFIKAEVIKIEDEVPQDLHKNFKKVIGSDGYNTTLKERISGTRFLRYYGNDKGVYDSISFTLKKGDSTFFKTYKRELKGKPNTTDSIKTAEKKKAKPTKAERKKNKLAFKAKRKHNQKYGYNAARKEYNRNFSFIGKDSTIALLKVRGFSGTYKEFYDENFKTIDSLKTENLIIDLRNNFGGSLDEIAYLYSYLTDEHFTFINPSEVKGRTPFIKSMMNGNAPILIKSVLVLISPIIATIELLKTERKDGISYYKLKASQEKKPKPNNFKGKIYVLINGNSFSASAILSTKLHGDRRATFVGEETGGNYNGTVAGYTKLFELPNSKVLTRIGLLHIDAPNKSVEVGYGVRPDVEIVPTYNDRLLDKDPELEWVLKDIEGIER